MFSSELLLSGSSFHRVDAVTEKARVPAFVLTLRTVSKHCLEISADICLDESCINPNMLF